MTNPERHYQSAGGRNNSPEPRRSSRREQRCEAAITVAVCGFRADGRVFFEVGASRNLSRSGCCVHLRTEPQADSVLAVRALPGGEAQPSGEARQCLFQIVWLEPEDGGWAVGASSLGESTLYRLAFPARNP